MRKMKPLRQRYPKLREFFQDILLIRNVDILTLVSEVAEISAGDDLTYIADLLGAVSESLRPQKDDEAEAAITQLLSKPIFPIRHGSSQCGFDELLSGSPKDLWFMADRPHLRQSFEGRAPLLAFDSKQMSRVKDLLRFLKLEERYLSRSATGLVDISGTSRKHVGYTDLLRSKAHLVAR